ncbi:MAG: energy transducer TonB [Sandaracinus sp.]
MEPRARRTPRRRTPGERDLTRAYASFALLSLLVHVGAVSIVPAFAPSPAAAREPVVVEVDLTAGDGTTEDLVGAALRDTPAAQATPGGATSIQNVDADDRGRGGDGIGASHVLLLLPTDAPLTLTDATMNATGIGQTQRIDTARDRASWEDRRATPSPDDDPFLASGHGPHRERRPVAATDAAEGATRAPDAATAGGASPERTGDTPRLARAGLEGRTAPGAVADSPGTGILEGEGTRASEAAAVAHGRPEVDLGPAATTTEERDRPRDDQRSEQLATAPSRSLVEATERSGASVGEGVGGIAAEGPTGSGGGAREGGHALARGSGPGPFDALDTHDPRYVQWLRALHQRVDRVLEFPRARQLAMDQGTSVFRLVVRRDGSLDAPPRLIRSSGFTDLDTAARTALDRSLPLDPVPSGLFVGRAQIEITVPIEFWNPMAR